MDDRLYGICDGDYSDYEFFAGAASLKKLKALPFREGLQLADKVCKLKQTERNEAVFEEKRALA